MTGTIARAQQIAASREDRANLTRLPMQEQLSALCAFQDDYGPNWREELCDQWRTGKHLKREDGHLLQQVRNRLGPRWLFSVLLPNEKNMQ